MNCGKCGFPFTVVAFLSQGVDKDAWMRDTIANSHDCEAAASHRVRSMGIERVGQQKQKGKK
ncbi:MAG: hypothetical protein IT175_10970 [Acidobacteria bacterium]|nr:hypothetical protein [Acidobacteriota bacterium]